MKEVWKDIKNYEGLYQISNFGRIKSLSKPRKNGKNSGYYTKEKILKQNIQIEKYGYKRYKITLTKNNIKKCYKVHRLVAEAFIPNPLNKPQINHIDGNPLNNNVNNLEWCTARENIIHSYKFLRKQKYNKNELLKMIKENKTPKEICKKLKISNTIYYNFLKKNNIKAMGNSYWKNKYNINLNNLLDDFKKGYTNKQIQQKYNCSKSIVATRKYQFRKKGLL